MRRFVIVLCSAVVFGVATVSSAQTRPADTGATKDVTGETSMMTGCVAMGSMADHYMLTNAMKSSDMKETTMKRDMKGMSYDLMGGDLKAHVGHEVEVTGMMDMSKKGMMDKGTMEKDRMDKKDSRAMMSSGTIQVKSVKMIAATCP